MTHTFDLDFTKPKDTDLPGPPRAFVYIKSASIDNRGYRFISPACVSMVEFDYEVDQLIKELEAIRKKAKRKFSVK